MKARLLRPCALLACVGAAVSFDVFADTSTALTKGCLEAVAMRGEAAKNTDLKSFLALFDRLMSDLRKLEDLKRGAGLTAQDKSCAEDKARLLDDLLKKAQPEYRRSADYLATLGDYYLYKNNIEEARNSYMAALGRDTLHIRSNMALARLARDEGELKLEDLHLKRAITDKPRNDNEVRAQADAFARLVELSPSIESFELLKAWEKIEPKNPLIKVRAAEISLKMRKLDKLESQLPELEEPLKSFFAGELAALKKNSVDTVRFLTQYLKQSREKDKDRALEARLHLARAYLDLNQGRKARIVIEGALKKSRDSKDFLALYDEALEKGGLDLKNKIEDLKSAAMLSPNSEIIQLQLIEAMMDRPMDREGGIFELRQSEAIVDRFLAQHPNQLDALYWKVVLSQRSKAFSKAEKFVSLMLEGLRKGQHPRPSLSEADLWAAAATNLKARGLFGESEELLREGLSRVEAREDKEKIRRLLANKKPPSLPSGISKP